MSERQPSPEDVLPQGLLPDFVSRLKLLSDDDWARCASRVPELSGDSASALVARAERFASSLPSRVPAFFKLGLGLWHAVRSEFPRTPDHRRVAVGNAAGEALRQVYDDLSAALEGRRVAYPGVVAAIESVFVDLGAQSSPVDDAFVQRYAFIEPEIPYASLRPSKEAGGAGGEP